MNEYITPGKIKVKPRIIWGFDTEDNSKGEIISIDFFNGKKHFTFREPEKALIFLYSLKIPKNKYFYFFAHNVEYDLINLFKNHFNLIDKIVWNNFVIFATLKNKNIVFCDTMNLSYNATLKTLGDIIGLKKLDFNPDSIEYVQRDSEITYYYVEQLQDLINKEYKVNLKYTLPGIATDIWRNNFLNHKIKRLVNDQIFQSYFGGRTEAFFIGRKKGNINYCDVNSMYPFMMLKDFPDTGDIKNIDSLNVNFGYGKFRVIVNSKIPLLPVRFDNKIYFPNGVIIGIWTIEEIKNLIKSGQGELKEIYWINGTDKGFPFFREYSKHFYEKKKNADNKFYRNFYKLILNSLYGKFGEKRIGETFIDVRKLDKSKMEIKRIFQNKLIVKTGNITDSKISNPLWSSYVTAYSRIYLWQNLSYIDDNADLLYCDTDSIIYTNGKNNLLPINNKIGGWSLEKFNEIEIKGNKFYRMKNKKEFVYKSKGIPKNEQEIFFDLSIATFLKPIKLRESLGITGINENQKIKIMNYWTYITKELKTNYDKRRLLNSGFTEPFDILEIEPMKIKLNNKKETPETLRSQILKFGGIKYNIDIPKYFFKRFFYLFRKRGKPIDELLYSLNSSGWNFEGNSDFFNKIDNGYLNNDLNGINLTFLQSEIKF